MQCSTCSYFPLIFPLLIISIAIFVAIKTNAQESAALKKLSPFLPGTMPKFSFSPTYTGDYEGLKFNIVIMPGGRNSPPRLQIWLVKNASFRLRIYKENILTLWAEKIGLVRELKTGDPGFDADFLIFSSNDQQALTYLSNAANKENIRKIFNYGFSSLVAGSQRVIIEKVYSSDQDVAPDKIVDIIRTLGLITRGF
jgi:hypothetical protein